MSELSDIKKIVNLFSFYYKNVNKMDYYVFKMSDSNRKVIINFIEQIKLRTDSKLQDDFLKQYFDFHFNRRYKKENPHGKGISIQIHWIIGKKAIDDFFASDKLKSAYSVRKNLKKDVDFKHKIEKEDYTDIFVNINKVEESDKARFFGSMKGYMYCGISTNLFNHLSDFCSSCKNSSKCKEDLKNQFPKIYKARGYV